MSVHECVGGLGGLNEWGSRLKSNQSVAVSWMNLPMCDWITQNFQCRWRKMKGCVCVWWWWGLLFGGGGGWRVLLKNRIWKSSLKQAEDVVGALVKKVTNKVCSLNKESWNQKLVGAIFWYLLSWADKGAVYTGKVRQWFMSCFRVNLTALFNWMFGTLVDRLNSLFRKGESCLSAFCFLYSSFLGIQGN